jgi:predicted PurR-regulated permease PerM
MGTPGRADDGATARPRTGAWDRLPLLLRTGGLASGCLLLIAGAVYAVGWVAVRLASLTVALVAAVLIAALLEQVVAGLCRLRVPRGVAALGAVLLFLAAMLAPAVALWRLTVDQFGDLAGRIGQGLERIRALLTDVLPVSEEQVDRAMADLATRAGELAPDPVAGALTVVEVLAAVVLALFVAFFLLKDGRAMRAWLLVQLPERLHCPTTEAISAGWETLTRYVRGTLVVAAIDALGIGVALAVIGVPLALPLALLVFVGSAVPYVGATVTGTVAVLVALATNGPVDALLVLASVIAVQQIEGNLLEPLIVGRQVRLHPVVVVVVVFAGSLSAGIAGAVIAVPLTAVCYRVIQVLRASGSGRPAGVGGSKSGTDLHAGGPFGPDPSGSAAVR